MKGSVFSNVSKTWGIGSCTVPSTSGVGSPQKPPARSRRKGESGETHRSFPYQPGGIQMNEGSFDGVEGPRIFTRSWRAPRACLKSWMCAAVLLPLIAVRSRAANEKQTRYHQ